MLLMYSMEEAINYFFPFHYRIYALSSRLLVLIWCNLRLIHRDPYIDRAILKLITSICFHEMC